MQWQRVQVSYETERHEKTTMVILWIFYFLVLSIITILQSLENHHWIYTGYGNVAKWQYGDGAAVFYGIYGFVMVAYEVARCVSSHCCTIVETYVFVNTYIKTQK